MGDFNLPSIDFAAHNVAGLAESMQTRFLWQWTELGLVEHVQRPIRLNSEGVSSMLDYVLANDPLLVDDIEILNPLGKRDHAMIIFKFLVCTTKKLGQLLSRRNVYTVDYEEFNKALAAPPGTEQPGEASADDL
ncbi:unnamed protein product [Echinostoma caproni]|uniref:Endo/exonuclease/phosphatase domain-containing protein n=1 Tax=Echinostoma caproni TaxID=27848 RepID=A0A183AXE2_9TREM|nr:unnamed protein product [Echinostoma caproni]